MGSDEDDHRDPPADPSQPDAPLQVLFPNLDKVSRSSFTKGTVSRRRINRSLVGLAVVAVIIVGIVVASTLAPGL